MDNQQQQQQNSKKKEHNVIATKSRAQQKIVCCARSAYATITQTKIREKARKKRVYPKMDLVHWQMRPFSDITIFRWRSFCFPSPHPPLHRSSFFHLTVVDMLQLMLKVIPCSERDGKAGVRACDAAKLSMANGAMALGYWRHLCVLGCRLLIDWSVGVFSVSPPPTPSPPPTIIFTQQASVNKQQNWTRASTCMPLLLL